MNTTILFLVLAAGVMCAACQVEYVEQIKPHGWSVPNDGLSVQLRIDNASVPPTSGLRTKLFIRANNPVKHAKLLQGRVVYTFVPVGHGTVRQAIAAYADFSGGGGIDYRGMTAMEYSISTPNVEGKYYLFATILSTDDDVKAFLMTARVSASAGPWWIGAMSSPPVPIAIVK